MSKEGRGVRAAETDERPQKSPRLGSRDSRWSGVAKHAVSSPAEDEDSEPCRHLLVVEDQLDSVIAKIRSRDHAPVCEHCWLESFQMTPSARKQQRDRPGALIMVCLECKRCLCAGVGVAITDYNPCGHAWFHAHKKGHGVALWFDEPNEGFCFFCDSVFYFNESDTESEVLELDVDNESGAHASCSDTDDLCYVIRGIPNHGNTCYVNALLQCLLALDKMRMWMLGPNAPMGSLGEALKELFVATTPGNDARAELNPNKLLGSLGALNARYAGTDMQDSHELLLDMRNGLNGEEKQQWPPKVRNRYPTVVDSIFLGQISSTLTCKRCQFDSPSHEPFSELSLTLPSKGYTTKSVDSSQRSLAIEESNLKKVQTDATDKEKASEPLKSDCTKEEQVWQRENDLLGILQTQEDNISCSELLLEVIEVPQKSADVGDLSSQKEIPVEPNENTLTVQVTPEGKGKALSRSFIHANEEDNNSLASIEHCLAHHFKGEEVEWHCDNCAKVCEEAGAGSVEGSASTSTTNEGSDRDGKAEKILDTSIVQDSQNASTPPNIMKEIDRNIADQAREHQKEQEDRKGHADKTVVISKLPSVLTVHLKRFEKVNGKLVKVQGHVSFHENIDVGQFVDPRSEDKDHSRYRLGGVIEHIGSSLHIGHNVAYVRASTVGSGSSLWFRASDLHIEKISLEEVLKCEAFIIFYERMEGQDTNNTRKNSDKGGG